MNRIYRVIFSTTTGRYAVVAEHAKSRGKRGSSRVQAMAAAWLLASQAVWAAPGALELPVHGQVTAGQATVQAGSGAALTVNQTTERASIQWQSFNIGAGASVNFRQPSAQSVTLNRVQGTAPSEIFGNLQANGQVFVLNPNGILFGPTAQVNVGGIVATTHSLSDADFMAGRAFFDRAGARGAVVNQGNIHTALAGYAALLAPEVRNEGIIVAQMGTVALASGEAISLQFEGSSAIGLTVTPSTIASLVANQRAIQAPGGLIILAAQSAPALASGVIQNSGSLQATGAALKNGRIVLQASDQALMTGASVLDVGNATGTGGSVMVTADHIALADSAVIKATGSDGGGTIHIGGGWQGTGDTPQASAVYVGQDVRLDASATHQGAGGEVVVWSDVRNPASATRVYGSLLAQGGAQGGDGGRIETSGHWLDVSGIRANASAINGRSGLWLLDPFNLDVTTTATTASTAGGPPYTFSSGSGTTNVLNTDISAQLNTGTSVVLQTTGTAGDGQGRGDIEIFAGADIAKTSGGDATLSFKAHGDIYFTNTSSITSTAGKLNLVFNSDLDGNGQGFIYLFDATVRTNGGNIAIGGGVAGNGSGYAPGSSVGSDFSGINLDSSTVDAGGGSISLRGKGNVGNFSFSEGVGLYNSVGPMLLTTSGTGSITIDGVGGGTGSGLQRINGVVIRGSSVTNTGTGDITITGVPGSAATTSGASGVTLSTFSGTGSTVSAAGGNVSITGTGSVGTGNGDNYGVYINGASNLVSAGGNGTVTIVGTGGAGAGTTNAGIGISSGSVTSASGAISLTGLPGGTAASGILLAGTASIASTGNAPVSLTSDSLDLAATSAVSAGTGTVTVQNRTAGTLVNLGGADVLTGSPLTLGLSQTELARITAGTLVLGRNDATAAGAMTVSSAVAPTLASNLTLKTGSTLAINAPITVNNTLTLSALGNVSQTVGGNISATNLLFNGPGNYALASASSNAVSALAAVGTGAISYQNSSAMQIGSAGGVNGISASGPVYVGTTNGNITLAQTIQTSDSSNTAVVLNAGQAAAAGTASGGNISITGGAGVNVGVGGRATLMTGAVAGSTGLTAVVGAGSGNFRYNSDETATNYTAPLGAGRYAVYRESPTVTIAANNASKTYDAASYSGGNGFGSSGFVNGDTVGGLLGTVAYGGSAQGARNAGSYSIVPSGLGSDLGYTLAFAAGSLTVNPAAITLSASSLSKTYDGSTTATGSPSVAGGTLYGSDSLSGGSFAFTDKNVGSGNKTVTVSGITISDGNGGANYVVSYASNTSSSITPANLTVTAPNVSKPYDGTTQATGVATVGALAGAGAGETVGTSPALAFNDKNAGPGKTVQATGLVVLDSGGVDVTANYAINYVASAASTITAASLSVTAPSVTKTYDGTTQASGAASVGGLAGAGDSVGSSPLLAFTDKDAGTGKTVQATGLVVRDSGGVDVTGNYAVNYVDNTSSVIQKAPLTVSANADARFVTQADTVGYYGASYSGFVAGEAASVLGGSLAISRPNAATDVAAGTYVGALVPAGLTSGNYTISFVPGNYTIVPANQLLVRVANSSVMYGTSPAFNVTSAQYLDSNGSTIHDLAGSASGNSYSLVDGVGGGVNFTLKPSGATLSSAGHMVVGNYAVNDPAALVTGNNFNALVFVGNLAVTPKPVTASAASGLTKIYDGTTGMTGVSLALAGQEAADLLTVSGAGAFSQKNVGSGLDYTVNNLSLGGVDAGNYYLVSGSSFSGSNGAISLRPVTVTGITATDKVYDGSTLAGLAGLATVAAVAGDDLAVGGGVGSFADKNVGNGKTVTASGYSLSGVDAANYTVVQPTGLAASITPRTLNVVVSGNDKAFDGTTLATVSTSDNRVAGDVLDFQVDARFLDPNVGTGKPVAVNTLTLSGLDAGNYTVAASGNVVADITATSTPPLPPVTPPTAGPVAPLPASSVVLPSGNAIDGLTRDGRSVDPELRVLPQSAAGLTEIRTAANTPGFVRVQTFEPLVGPVAQIFGFTLPPDTFVHSDPAATIALDARTASGGPLPPWLTFNPGNRRFSGTPPADVREVVVVVTARDPVGNEASTKLVMTFVE